MPTIKKMATCPKCKETEYPTIDYDPNFDAQYCRDCDIWLEAACSDPNCFYFNCSKRPGQPSQVHNI